MIRARTKAAGILLLAVFMATPTLGGGGSQALERQLSDLQKAFSFFKQELEATRQDKEKLAVENQRLKQQIRRLQRRVRELESGARMRRRRTEKAVVAELQQKVVELQDELRAREREIAALRQALETRAGPEPTTPEAVDKEAGDEAGTQDRLQRIADEASDLIAAQDFDGALEAYKQILAARPEDEDALLGAAVACYGLNDLDSAEEYCRKVLQLDPQNPQALGLSGVIAWRRDDAVRGLELLDQAVAQAPDDAQLHNYRGIVLHSLGRRAEAEEEFRRAADLDPTLAEVYFNLAVVLCEKGDQNLPEARRLYEKSVSLGSPRDEVLEKTLYGETTDSGR